MAATDASTLYAEAVCCRTWILILYLDGLGYGWQRCGLCDTKPVLIRQWWE